MNENKKEIWQEFCRAIKAKLKEITDPVALTGNRSYDSLVDVVSNVILLEVNIDREPFDQIPKTKVRLPRSEDLLRDAERFVSEKEIAELLLEKISPRVSYQDRSADDMPPETVKAMGLYSALRAYLSP